MLNPSEYLGKYAGFRTTLDGPVSKDEPCSPLVSADRVRELIKLRLHCSDINISLSSKLSPRQKIEWMQDNEKIYKESFTQHDYELTSKYRSSGIALDVSTDDYLLYPNLWELREYLQDSDAC